jgi:hypothetical protein
MDGLIKEVKSQNRMYSAMEITIFVIFSSLFKMNGKNLTANGKRVDESNLSIRLTTR